MALTRPRYSQIPDTDWKQSVRVATTEDVGNVMLAAMPSTVDGVTLNFYDRVLLTSQANAAQNGIYYVKAVGTGSNGIWERTKDASSGGALGAVTPSIVTQVEEGTINKNRTFKLTTTGNIDLGTTNLSFGIQAAEPAGATGQLQFANVNNVIGGATTTSYDYTTGNLVLTGNVNTSLLYQNGKRVPQVYTSITPPSTPAVGDQWYQVGTDILYEWLQDGATAYWIDVSGATIANINPITGENVGTLVVNGGNESTSTTTGALQVVGGVGITGNLNVGGSVSFGGGQLGSDLVISSVTPSTSETTGAIKIASPGGLGVGGNIWAGGAIVANSRIPSTSITTGAIVLPGTGGIGIGGNVWVGQDVNVVGNITGGGVRQTISSTAPANPTVGDQWYQLGTDILYQYVSDGTGRYWVDIAGATVANISAQSQQSLTDIQIVSGTPSTSASTGALTVSGGVGIQGNLNLQGGFNISGGNLIANQNVTSTNTTTGSMVITGQGGLGVGGNINIGGNISIAQSASFGQNVSIAANLITGGTYFSAAGLSVTNGNIVTTGTSAQIGGLTISNGAISGLASLGVTGATNIGGDLTVTGNISGGGVRKYAQVSAPANPVPGDVWYKTDTDVYYTYINDGTNKYWIDYTSATVSNTNPLTASLLNDLSIQSTTPATNTTSGALQVAGGAGIAGNVYTGNLSTGTVAAQNFTYANGVSILAGNEGTYSNANVTAYLTARTTTISDGFLSTAGMTVTAGNLKTTSANIGGVIIENGGLSSLSSLSVIGAGTVGGDFAVTGNITGGGLRKYAQINAPASPVVGDVWYKTDTDVYYTYVNDGTNKYWIDYTSASVSNANPTSPQSLSDLQIVSGTPATNTTSGALQVTGGAGISGNVFTGNLSTSTVSATNFTFANGVSILAGNEGTYSNANVTAYLAASNISIGGNLTAGGSYFSAGGLSVTAGNIVASGARAVIGGLTIENGGISSLASLNVVGSGTLGGDFAITGNITAGGLRKYAQVSAPTNPVVGDVWYKTDTDVFYQYVNDGTSKYWIDYTSATVSNASPTSPQSLQDLQIVSGTPSTGLGSGALQVTGGASVTGNVFTGNLSTTTVAASNFTYANGVSILAGNEGTYSNANVTAYLTARNVTIADGNITATGGYLSAGGFTATAGNIRTTSANIGGVIIESGGIGQLASLGVLGAATIGGDVAITGNITAGGLRKYAQINAPANPVVGDVWYKTDTDVYYQYITDGTKNIWVDYSSATVSNANPTSPQSLQDLQIVSGTSSTSTTSGALQVTGGVGVSGNIYVGGNATVGNLSTGTITGTAFTYANGVSILAGNEGTYSNANVTAYLTARTTTITDGYLSTAGMTVTAGNLKTASANIGGVIIESGGIGQLASLGVVGAATIGGDLAVTGNITGGGLRKYAQINAPATPVVGDVWYKTDTDVYYQYVNDGTNKYWVDYSSATVSNASPTSPQSLQDLQIVSGTPATSTASGALQVTGGAGITGNVFAGNLNTTTIAASNFTYANGVSILAGNEGTYSNANVTAYLTARSVTIADGNITASGSYFSAGGISITAGNILATSANIGGVIISGGGIGQLASLGVTGAATIGGDLAVTGNITGGGIRKTSSISAPASPTVGDQWYKTDTDTLYQYINDGTSKYWIDVAGATVSNASITSSQIAYDIVVTTDTQSTSTTTGAIRVQGGIGLIGNIYTTGIADFGGNLTAGNITANNNLQTNTLAVVQNATIGGTLNVTGVATTGNLVTGNITGYGFTTNAGNLTATGQYFSAGGFSATAGNLSGYGFTVSNGNVITTGTKAVIGGLTIQNGGFGSLASLDVTGAATFGANVDITGRVTGGGIRKTSSTTAPASPTVGDTWYKTDTDTLYQYINDGASNYWIDISGATVANISPQTSQTLNDIVIVSGTPATNTTSGALQVQGGAGITGNVFTGNLSTATISATAFTFANGVSILAGNEGTYSNANVTAYLTAKTVAISDAGNITTSGTYFNTAGLTVLNGNITATGTTATIGGLVINNGSLPSLPTIGVLGAATIGGDLAVTGNITGGGLRKYAQISAPANPVVGDVWYKTDTDVFYQYVNDGTNKYWIDYTSATVSNASPTTSQSLQDLQIVSGTPSTSTSTGALVVQGGTGISGNIFVGGNATVGNLSTTTIAANGFTYANGVSILAGNEGTYSNANVTAYLTARTTTITDGFLSTAGMTVTAGNLKTTSANIGGVIIESGGIGSLASLNVIGGATIGGDVVITGNVTGGGIRKTTSISAPANPVVGDQWYKSDTDTLYQYINDGTTKYWVDVAGATVSNARISSDQIDYDIVITTDTQSTSPTTGAVRVQGGIGLIGNIFTTGIANFGGNLTAGNILANNNLQTTTLQVTADANVTGNLAVNKITAGGNITSAGTYFSAAGISVTNGNVIATGTTATIGGLVINNGGLPSLPTIGVIGAATFGANVDVTGNVNVTRDIIASGNIVAGGVRKYAQISKPTNAVPGDVWYKTDTDVYYTYVNDGTNSYWIDYVGATVSNAAVDNSVNQDFTIASGTLSTDPNTGALVVVGGVGVTGDINTTGDFTIDGTFTACTAVTAGYLNVADGIDSYGNVIIHGPGTANYTVQVRSSDAADNVLGIKTSAPGGGFAIDALNSELIGATPLGINANTFSIGIKNSVGTTVQADAFKLDTAGNASVAKTLSVGQHVNVTGNVTAGAGTFTSVFATTANLTTLNLSGTLTVPTLNVTTSIDAPGIRKYAQVSAPASPAAGDVWYKTDTDVYYTYVNDGTGSYWIDYVGATVSNAATTASQSVDLRVASGTDSINTDTGALTVVGGVGVTGNLNLGGVAKVLGNLVADSRATSTSTTTGAVVIPGIGGLGVGGNAWIGASANIGSTLNVATSATIGTTLNVGSTANVVGNFNTGGNISAQGRVDITGNLDVVGRVTGGGIRKTTSLTAPANPVVGDVWYKTDTDVLYQYVNDGTSNYWIDYVGPTVSNASPSTGLLSDLEIVTGTSSTSTTTGAARITGGVGITENLYVGGLATIGANLIANNITANLNLQSSTLAVTGAGTIGGNLSSANLSTGIATIARADIAGALTVGGDVTVTGNIVAGGVRKTQSTTPPANPTVGDLWYKTDTDVYYQYTSDGTNKYWIDYVGATVSNAAVSASTNNDYRIASGTESTNVDTGALTVVGGVGITGNVFAGNVSATSFRSDNFIFANGQPLASRITGTYSNTNVAAYLTGSITTGNIAAGNIATLDITARDVTLSGNITGGGLRKYAQIGAPANPVLGDVWYKTDTDVYYTYINDGTTNIWVDYIGATISNATVNNSTNSDFLIASGTLSTSDSTGALQVVGGVGVTGNINLGGNLKTAGTVIGSAFTYANGTSILAGNEGTYSNANVTAYLTARTTTISDGYLSTAGITVTAGNIFASSANIAGVIISNGGLSNLASLGVIGSATIGGDLAITGNVTGGGLRKYAQTTAPVNPVVGDVWYKTDTDVYYQYINDGTNKFWVDYVGPTVSNASITSEQIAYDIVVTTDTQSTSPTTGAIRVQGGIGLIGNIYTTGIADFGGNLRANNITANNNLQTNSLAVVQNATVGGTLDVTGALSSATLSTGNVVAGNITGYGFTTNAGNLVATGAYFSAGGISATAGNISIGNIAGYNFTVSNGNITSTGTYAKIGGLEIINGGFGSLASLGVTGGVTIGADLAVTGNVTGGGLRKTQSTTPPANPVQGDVWYKTDTDVYYQYINDGTSSYWIDYTSAAVANVTQNAATVSDLQIVSGTASTDYTNGALTVAGGVGVSGNININGNISAGNIATAKVAADAFTYANGASILDGYYFGTYSNANVTGYLTGQGVSTTGGNLTSTGSYFSAGGMSSADGNITVGNINAYSFIVSNGNITSTGTRAVVGGLTIENGGFNNLASLGVIGAVTIGGNLDVTGAITGGGIRKTTSINAPVNPVVGDLWYKTDTDVLYQFVHDGTSNYWVDYSSASVANAQPTSQQSITDLILVSGTPSTSSSTGALQVAGGIGVTGNINSDGNISAGNLTASNTVRTSNLDVTNIASIGTLNVAGTTTIVGNLSSSGFSVVQGNITASGSGASISGLNIVSGNIAGTNFNITNGNISASGSYFSAGGLSVTNGNIVATGTTATIGGLVIANGGFGSLASLDVTGSVTIGNNVVVTGNITGGGLRKTQSTTPPVNPVPGDVWYKTDSDVYYQYISDGTSSFWVDYTSAAVANVTVSAETVGDLEIVSGTESYDTSTGALRIAGGIGATGNLNLGANATIGGNVVIAGGARATQHNTGALVIAGNGGASIGGNLFIQGAIEIDRYFVSQSYAEFGEFVGVNGNIIGRGDKITGGGFQAEYGNVTATGQYFSAGGLTALAGNVTLGNIVGYGFSTNNGNLITTGSRAVVGGLTIENGGFGAISSLNVIGSATIGNNLTVTGNITGGGIRKTTSITAPANPVVGDVWYKQDTDVYYTYVNDGTNTYWIDYTSATVANISTANAQYGTDVAFVSGTLSTNQTTGAVVVIGGVGVTGNINLTGQVTALDTVTGQRIVSNTSITAQTLSLSGNATLGNITGYGFTTNNGNVVATGQLTVGGLATVPGNLVATGQYFSAGGLSVTAGNITGYGFSTSNGNVIATGTYAQIGGLVIQNGGFGSLASLDVTGAVTFGANLDVTGRITGGGIRKTSSISAPANPVVGDQWYKTDTDILYQYINDGTSNYWIDTASASVANVTVSAETVGDLEIVSGTPSVDPTTGALRVAGGVGVTGDVNISANITAGNVLAGKVYSTNVLASAFTYPNGASILDGYYFGTYSNANIVSALAANGITATSTGITTTGNLSASGNYFLGGGLTSLNGNLTAFGFSTSNGNITSTGARAVVGGLTIENGGFADLANLGVIGNITAGGDVAITGNITAGGLRKYAQTSAPTNPVVGDVWYKTDTDVYYQYITDGTTNVWVDYVSATVADLTLANAQLGYDIQFVSGTTSTNQITGAVTVIGGVGVTGNINLTGRVTALETITGQAIVANTSIAGATLSIAGAAAVGNLTVGNITGYGFSTNNGNVVATGKLTVGGLSVVPGNLSATGSYLSVNGFTALNGNITATGTTATIGGLTIANGGFGSVASLDVVGSTTIGGNITVTGNIVAGGVRKTSSISAPASPTVGDQWYKTDTDILYQYIDDGTSTYWVDFASATVANITNDFDGLGDFQTIGNIYGNNVIANGFIGDNYYYANGVPFVTTTVANTADIVANTTNGFNLGVSLTTTGVTAGTYGSATSIPTVVVDNKGRVTSVTTNAVSTTFGLTGNVGTSSISGGDTLVVVGTPNQISTTVTGNTINIGFTPNISFTDFTVSGNLIYQGGGIKTTTSPTPPVGPVNGDMWYQSGTDILYRYVFDGTNEYWLDLFSTPLRAILPSRDIAGGDGEVQFNDDGEFGANVTFAFDKTTGTLKVERFRITKTQTPATPGSPGNTGEITWDGNWMYVCVAPNSWVRAGLYTW